MNAERIAAGLAQFTGTTSYYRVGHVLLTDGVQYLASEAGCFWLVDVIASHLPAVPTDEHFCIAVLKLNKTGGAHFEVTDDIPGRRFYGVQSIKYTDFPLDTIKLYCCRAGEDFVIMLPSEY